MNKFGIANGVVRTNQGGELAHCDDYRWMMAKEFGYTVKPTGADSASQNGGAEIYNNMLAVKVQQLLSGSGLPAKFWSTALLYVVYLYNHLMHFMTSIIPFEGWYGHKLDVTCLKTFGSHVCVNRPSTH